jgi:hypothetical protein
MPRVRKELVDFDYLDQLGEKELDWLNKFMGEWAGANITKSKKINRPSPKHLHKTNALAKDVMDANNHRNNDLYGVTKVNGLQQSLDNYTFDGKDKLMETTVNNPALYEDAMIKHIDDSEIQSIIDEYTPKPKKK